MKVGHVAAGIWRTIHLDMAKALQRLGHVVHVYTEDERLPTTTRLTRLDEAGVHIWGIHHEKRNPWLWLPDRLGKPFLGGRRFFTTLFAIWRYLRLTRCDIYMVEGDGLGIFLALLSRVMRFRWIICVHDHEHLGVLLDYPGEPSSQSKTRLKLWMLRQAHAIRANSYVTRDVMVRGGIDPELITVVPLHFTARMLVTADLATYRQESRRELALRYQLPATGRLMVALCRLTPFKGLELALQAFALSLPKFPDARFLIGGGDRNVPGLGSYRAILEKLAAELGLTDQLIFVGNIDPVEVKRYYAAADVHLVPSYIETFNYSAVEAALTGTPTLMTDKIGSGHWLQEVDAAYVVAGRDPASYAAVLQQALAAPLSTSDAVALARRTQTCLDVDTLAPQLMRVLVSAA